MVVNLDPYCFKLLLENIRRRLSSVSGDYYTAHIQSLFFVYAYKSDDILIVSDAEVVSDLVAFYVGSIYRYDHLSLVCKLEKHLKLTVRSESWKDSGCVIVIE